MACTLGEDVGDVLHREGVEHRERGLVHAASREAAQRACPLHVPALDDRIAAVGGRVLKAEDRAKRLRTRHGRLSEGLTALWVGDVFSLSAAASAWRATSCATSGGARAGEALPRAAPVRILVPGVAPGIHEGAGAGSERPGLVISDEVVLADPVLDDVQGITGSHGGSPQTSGRGTTTSSGRTKVRSGSISVISFFSTSTASRLTRRSAD